MKLLPVLVFAASLFGQSTDGTIGIPYPATSIGPSASTASAIPLAVILGNHLFDMVEMNDGNGNPVLSLGWNGAGRGDTARGALFLQTLKANYPKGVHFDWESYAPFDTWFAFDPTCAGPLIRVTDIRTNQVIVSLTCAGDLQLNKSGEYVPDKTTSQFWQAVATEAKRAKKPQPPAKGAGSLNLSLAWPALPGNCPTDGQDLRGCQE